MVCGVNPRAGILWKYRTRCHDLKIELADAYRDTALGSEGAELLSPCVQCGQCTFRCPTFRLLGDEWDGPRGRIYLIQKMLEDRAPGGADMSPGYSLETLQGRSPGTTVQHYLDRCLSCRSCEASCPEGVRYGRLLDLGRELAERLAPRPIGQRLARRTVRVLVPHRRRFTALLRAGQALRFLLPRRLRVRIPPRRVAGPWPGRTHARRMLVWQGCVQPGLAPDINAAAARVLDRFGIELSPAPDVCCGAISLHMAAADEARAHMRHAIDALWPHIDAGAEAIVFTASGCGMHFRDYGELLRDDPRYADKARRISEMTRDIAEIVTGVWTEAAGPRLPTPASPLRVVFQSSCSLQHGEKLNGIVEQVLKRAGFKLLRAAYPFMCCGAAGAYSLLQRELSESLRASKMETLLAVRPQVIATANIGCINHLSETAPVPVRHWIELLDESFVAAASASAGSEVRQTPA